MVVQKTINNLKERPKDERKVVAGGIAIVVIAVLLIAWAILFFKKIASGTQQVNLNSGAQQEFNPSNVLQAQQQIQAQQTDTSNQDLYNIRNDAAAQQAQSQQGAVQQQQAGNADAFGNTSGY